MRKISVRGVKNVKLRNMYRKAADRMLEQLLGPRMHITLELEFSDLMKTDKAFGLCHYDECEYNPREFFVQIDHQQSLRQRLITLAHELIHVKQFARKELYDMPCGRTRWRKEIVQAQDIPYRDLPWEKEAFLLQDALYSWFKRTCKIRLKDYEDSRNI